MNKGCVIALIVAVVLLVLGAAGAFFVYKKMGGVDGMMDMANAGVVFFVEQSAVQYQAANPDAQIEPTNSAWATALKGQIVEGESIDQFIVNGELVDAMRRPLQISVDDAGMIKATSPGKDSVFGTEDDITSEMLKEFEEKFGGAGAQ